MSSVMEYGRIPGLGGPDGDPVPRLIMASVAFGTPTRIALAWVLGQGFPTFPLIGPRSVAELRDCLGALDVRLGPHEVAWLNLES